MTLKNKLAALREESLRVTRAQQERYEEFKRQERAGPSSPQPVAMTAEGIIRAYRKALNDPDPDEKRVGPG
jgi:DNA/RNA-binding domain of Phe-tRNA-synthetase-like protein